MTYEELLKETAVRKRKAIAELNAALDSLGIHKRARPEKTAEDLFADDVAKATELFGKDNVY